MLASFRLYCYIACFSLKLLKIRRHNIELEYQRYLLLVNYLLINSAVEQVAFNWFS